MAGGGQPERRSAAELLLPALTVVCGLQAFRVAVTLLWGWRDTAPGGWHQPTELLLAVAASYLVPLAVMVGRPAGAARTAAGLAAALAAARLAAQAVHGLALPVYGLLGSGLFAAWCTLWAASTPPRGRLAGLLLGLALALCDAALAGGYDFVWQSGWVPLLAGTAWAAPLLGLAVVEARRPAIDAPQPVVAVLGLPLAVAVAVALTAHPARLSALCGWDFDRAATLLLVANVAAVYLGAWGRRLLRRSSGGPRGHRPRRLFVGLLYGSTAVAVLGLVVGRPLLPLAALGAPAALALGLVALFEAWPVGRRHFGAVTTVQLTWLLAALLVAAGDRTLAPAAVALIALAMLAGVALGHLPDPDSSPPLAPTSRLALAPLAALLVLVVRGPAPERAEVLDLCPAVRVASLDVGAGHGARATPLLAAQADELRELRPQMVLLRGLRAGHGLQMHAVGPWLGNQLGLRPATLPGEPDQLFLAPVAPDRVKRVAAGVLVAEWTAGGEFLAAAQIAGQPRPAQVRAAAQSLRFSRYRLIAGDSVPALGRLTSALVPWLDLGRRLAAADRPAPLLLHGGHLLPLHLERLSARLSPAPAATALLAFER